MPKVSVILISFNHAKYIRESIDSVLNQTYTDFELIILDDASTDNSWELINQYTDPRIKAFRSDEQGEITDLIYKTISEVVAGKYIAMHQSNDVWVLDKLEKQVAFLDVHHEIGAVFSNALAIAEDSSPLVDEKQFFSNNFDQPNRTRHEWLRYFFNYGNALCHPSVLIRKVCFDDCGIYRFDMAQLGDLDMWIRLCLKYEIHVQPEKLVRFRVRDVEVDTSISLPETRIREFYEFYKLLPNYRKLTRFDDLAKVFPSAEKYYRNEETEIDFALGMVILEEMSFPFTFLFGQDLVCEAISDPKRAANIKRLYDFDYTSFIALTGQNDVFSQEEILSLKQVVYEREVKIASLNHAVYERNVQIDSLNYVICEREVQVDSLNRAVHQAVARYTAIENSTIWKMTLPLRTFLSKRPLLRKFVRYTAKLIWWMSTFQLGSQLREWRVRNISVTGTPDLALPNDDLGLVVPLSNPVGEIGIPDLAPPVDGDGLDVPLGNTVENLGAPDLAPPTDLFVPLNNAVRDIAIPHLTQISDDFSLVVPLDYSIEKWKSVPSVAVICHMFFPELAVEFQHYLSNIPYPFDLFITTDTLDKKLTIENHFSKWNRGKIEVRLASNRGRDIAPKLITCRDVYDDYEYFLHIHTKKSQHHTPLSEWRTYLLETLLGSEEIVASIFESFKCDKKLGMIAPQHYKATQHEIGWGLNFKKAMKLASKMGIKISLDGRLDFPSGSMFWARSASLRPLLDCNITLENFPIETYQIDGTLAHVIEHLYFFACERAGYRWIKIIQPKLHGSSVERLMHIYSQNELFTFIKDNQYNLLKLQGKSQIYWLMNYQRMMH